MCSGSSGSHSCSSLPGLEIDVDRLRGRQLGAAGSGFVVSFAIAVVVALALAAGGQVDTPLLVVIILVATSLGVVLPVLKDAGEAGSNLGQLEHFRRRPPSGPPIEPYLGAAWPGGAFRPTADAPR